MTYIHHVILVFNLSVKYLVGHCVLFFRCLIKLIDKLLKIIEIVLFMKKEISQSGYLSKFVMQWKGEITLSPNLMKFAPVFVLGCR